MLLLRWPVDHYLKTLMTEEELHNAIEEETILSLLEKAKSSKTQWIDLTKEKLKLKYMSGNTEQN